MLYLHVPFCKQACHYCNFHFSTSLKFKTALLEAMLLEIELQAAYLRDKVLPSVYFGGGTPSLLSAEELNLIFNKIGQHFQLSADAEITLEANPDDLHPEYLRRLRGETPINRLSIGVQSFSDADLQWMNRAHSAKEAIQSIENALKMGFDQLTLDLIYGAPSTSDAQWATNIDTFLQWGIPHLSCYALTVEDKTALAHFIQKGKSAPLEEEKAERQFEYLMNRMAEAGYEHYEISNFALPGRHAQHNSRYWQGAHYLGIGPSAHSFNGISRQWNVANNARYIQAVQTGQLPFELEMLSPENKYNEYILTALRTKWGCSEAQLQALGVPFKAYFLKKIDPFVQSGQVLLHQGVYTLSRAGKLLADRIALDLFFE